ncbi:type II secretion system protein [Pseudomonas sp.]|uniref:type II secretion system protein n=1 Tax=Pseudomonas sp. TaxID=306 RepID=UPI00299E6DAF|nr:type II secretion system protein [Pseudomonas sp.]MDX1368515.1 type II secretion system protein [Pseudomonas sp.]
MRNGKHLAAGHRGFSYIGVLFLIVLMGTALAGAGQLWSTISQRAKERELLWVGSQYAQALRSYYRRSPGVALYPQSLDELLDDRRFPAMQRHLRRLYPDPMTGSSEWGLLHSFDGRIAGVYSRSQRKPMKQAHFPAQWVDFEGMGSYSDWQFVAEKSFLMGAQTGQRAPKRGVQ